MSEKNPIRVFVSHTFSETDDYLRLFEFLECVDRFYYVNVSKPDDIPPGGLNEIKDSLIQQIKESEAVVVLPVVFETNPDLTNFMMDVADANGKPIIVVRPYGHDLPTPPPLLKRCKEQVEWNAREMVDAIRRQARLEDTNRWEVVDFPGFDKHGEIKE
ncbi:MAG TPA: hypothetical protein PKK10_17905 [Woeseiaceae bacterium]|nr:hypothetical protein [Woeseiaceae bacterium]